MILHYDSTTRGRHAPSPASDTAPDPGDDWYARASCLGQNTSLFFPREGADERPDSRATRLARSICIQCPVRYECLNAALDEETGRAATYRYGIRGGLTGRQRAQLAQRREGIK